MKIRVSLSDHNEARGRYDVLELGTFDDVRVIYDALFAGPEQIAHYVNGAEASGRGDGWYSVIHGMTLYSDIDFEGVVA